MFSLQLLLFETERAWAYSQELYTSSLQPANKENAAKLRHSATGRFRRSIHWCTQLLSHCQSLFSTRRLSAENMMEASAYTLILSGRFLRFRDEFEDALDQLWEIDRVHTLRTGYGERRHSWSTRERCWCFSYAFWCCRWVFFSTGDTPTYNLHITFFLSLVYRIVVTRISRARRFRPGILYAREGNWETRIEERMESAPEEGGVIDWMIFTEGDERMNEVLKMHCTLYMCRIYSRIWRYK